MAAQEGARAVLLAASSVVLFAGIRFAAPWLLNTSDLDWLGELLSSDEASAL